MQTHHEPDPRAELPDLGKEFAALLTADTEPEPATTSALLHSLARYRRRDECDESRFQSVIDWAPSEPGGAIG
jgi:hypothetical protein